LTPAVDLRERLDSHPNRARRASARNASDLVGLDQILVMINL